MPSNARGTHWHTDWRELFMKYATEMRSGAMIYIYIWRSFIKIGSPIEKLTGRGGGYRDIETTWRSHKPTFICFQNVESRLKMWKSVIFKFYGTIVVTTTSHRLILVSLDSCKWKNVLLPRNPFPINDCYLFLSFQSENLTQDGIIRSKVLTQITKTSFFFVLISGILVTSASISDMAHKSVALLTQ
jgi:hypothetical protein